MDVPDVDAGAEHSLLDSFAIAAAAAAAETVRASLDVVVVTAARILEFPIYTSRPQLYQ